MKIIAHDRFKGPVVMEVTSVLILDDFDNAIGAAAWHQPGHIQIAHIEDKDFHILASMLGHGRKTIVSDYQGVPVQPLSGQRDRIKQR